MSTPELLELRVRQMAWEADSVVSVTLARPDGRPLPETEAGSHIDVHLRQDLIRQYSLCRADGGAWTIAVLREPASRGGSAYIHTELRPGQLVMVGGPRNNFPLVDAQRYLFIAGGIGVTPLLPMIDRARTTGSSWRLLYGGRRRASMAFLDDLAVYGANVTIAPEDETGLLDLASALAGAGPSTAVYCCGPEALITATQAACERLGLPAPHVERFGPRAAGPGEAGGRQDTPFDVVVASSGKRFAVPPEMSIISVLSGAGLYVPTSCTEGYCGICVTEVLDGIPDHRDDYLTPEERATNRRMCICVGRSKSPELVLKL